MAGTAYRVLLEGEDGQPLPPRRDPYARHTDFDSAWCYVDDPAAFEWRHPWQPLPFDEYVIYEARCLMLLWWLLQLCQTAHPGSELRMRTAC